MIVRFGMLLAFCCGFAFAQTQTVTGTVTNALTSAPIGRAKVTLQGQNASQTVLTDAGGSFSFGGVPLGFFNLTAERTGFLPAQGQGQVQPMSFAPVNVEAEKKPDAISLRLTPTATFTGTVTDENGFPLAGSNIQLIRRVISDGRAKLIVANQGSGNDLGEFRISGLFPGSYLVCLNATASTYQRRHHLAYPTNCFSNATDPLSAQWINIGPGEERNLAFHLAPVPGIRVSGSIENPPDSVAISTKRTDPPGFPQFSAPSVDWDSKTSKFEIPAVLPGDYLITANSYVPNGLGAHAMRALHVGTEDIGDIRLVLRDGPYISGTVRMGDTPASSQNPVGVGFSDNLLSIYANASGPFKQQAMEPGDYSLAVFPAGGWVVQSITQGGVDVRDRKISIGADTEPAPIEIVLTQSGGTIEVSFPSVLAKTNSPVKLTLLRQSPSGSDWLVNGQPMVTNTGGTLSLANIPPGDYVLFAWPTSTEVEYLNSEVIQKYRSFGQAVSVREGETTRVTVKPVQIVTGAAEL